MDQARERTSVVSMSHIHPANRGVSQEESAHRSSDEEEPKPDEVEEATLPRHRRIAQRISRVIKIAPRKRRASIASSVHTRSDTSMDLSFHERQSRSAALRDAKLSPSRIGSAIQRAQSEMVSSERISDYVDAIQSEASARYWQRRYITECREEDEQATRDHDEADQLAAPRQRELEQPLKQAEDDQLAGPHQVETSHHSEHDESNQQISQQQHESQQPPAQDLKQIRRRTMFARFTGISFAARNQPLSHSGQGDNTGSDDAVQNGTSAAKKSKRKSLAKLLSRMSRISRAPAPQSTLPDHNEGNEEDPPQSYENDNGEGSSTDPTGLPDEPLEDLDDIEEAALPTEEPTPQLPEPPCSTRLEFRLDLQSGITNLLRSQTQKTQRRIIGDTLNGVSTIRLPDWHLGENKNLAPYTTDPQREELYYTAQDEPMPAGPQVNDNADVEQGSWLKMKSGRKVWLPHPNKRERTSVDKVEKWCDSAQEVEVEDAMMALEWENQQRGGAASDGEYPEREDDGQEYGDQEYDDRAGEDDGVDDYLEDDDADLVPCPLRIRK